MMRSARSTRTGEAPIYARITVSGQRAEFNINRNVAPENWNTAKGVSKGRSKRDIELNKYLESIRARISEIHAQLVKDEELINPVVLKNHYLGNIAGPRMLVETFNGVIAQYKEKLEMGDICLCTFLRWERCGKYLSEFLSKREGSPDIPIKKLTSGMIDDFEHFLRVTKENGNNAAVKYIRYLKKVTRIALANKWMDEDPFINKRYTRTQAKREALNEDELKRIMSLNLTELPSLEKVRDTFIFCCFTGLAFVDVSTLSKTQIVEDENGERWIKKPRQKTGEISSIPLLGIPAKILEKIQRPSDGGFKRHYAPGNLQSANERIPTGDSDSRQGEETSDDTHCAPYFRHGVTQKPRAYRVYLEDARSFRHSDHTDLRQDAR